MLRMPELIALARACVSLGFCVFILIYVVKILRRLRKTTVVAGRLFLAVERLRKANMAIFTGLILVYMFTVTLLVENYIVREVGRYLVSLSLPFFLYGLYKLYEVIR